MHSLKSLPLWTPAASVAMALTWLLPNANPPWLAFHKDAWIAGVLLVVFLVLSVKTWQASARMEITPMALLLLLLAACTLLQWVFGKIYFFGHAWLGAAYFLAAALCLVLAQRWEATSPNAVGDFLFAAVLIAALVTTGLMLAQWFQLALWEVWIQPVPFRSRPYGNLIQPNHAASLLVLAIVSLAWWVYRRKLGPTVALLGASYFGLFVAMSGSRIGLLSLTILLLASIMLVHQAKAKRVWIAIFLSQLLLIPLAVYFFSSDWSSSEAIATLAPEGALQRELTNIRQQVYSGYLKAVWQLPWLGYGFGQTLLAQEYLGTTGIVLPGLFTWSHNAFLDLALWFGVPVFLLAVLAVAFTLVRLVTAQWSTARWIYAGGVLVLLLHGMVELPLAYAYFLLPIALLTGAAQVGVRLPHLTVSNRTGAGVLLAMGVLLAALWYDYLRIEQAFNIWRFKQNNIGTYHPKDVPSTLVLDQFEALLAGLRSEDAMAPTDLVAFREAVLLHPSAAALQQLAEMQVLGGAVQEAQQTADLAWLVSRPDIRRALALRWQYLASVNPTYRAVTWRED